MKKSLLTVLITLCLIGVVFAQAGTTPAERPPGAGTQQNPFMIFTLGHLRWLSESSGAADGWFVNASTHIHVLQMQNIDASETINWNNGQGFKPIGHWFVFDEPEIYGPIDGNWFFGVYDGNGLSITNLYMNRPTDDTYIDDWGSFQGGMFGRLHESTVKNVRLVNNDFNFIGDGSNIVGNIAGEAILSTIENCTITGNITISGGYCAIGGITGYAYQTPMINNHMQGNMVANIEEGYVGGIVGWLDGQQGVNAPITGCSLTGNLTVDIDYGWVGGIAGEFTSHAPNTKAITDSYTTGDITVTGGNIVVGGIAGTYSQSATMERCFSRGDITGTGTSGATVGGIAGDSMNSNISFAYSSGNIYGSSNSYTRVGGIVGDRGSLTVRITNSHSTGNITGIANSGTCSVGGIFGTHGGVAAANISEFLYATGVITSSFNNAGGIVGNKSNNSSPINNSYFNNETSGVTVAAGTVGATVNMTNVFGRTVAQMKTQSNYTGTGPWNFTTIWAIDPEINNGYPYLRNLTYIFEEDDPPATFNPPVNLVAELDGTTVELVWELPNRNPVGFKVFRNQVEIAERTQTFYTDTTVTNNTEYTYHVTAIYANPDGESEPSETAVIHTMFPPRDISAVLHGKNVELNWLAPSGTGITGYNVYRDGDKKTPSPISDLFWFDDDTEPETVYTYGVSAVYSAGESVVIEYNIETLDDLLLNPPVLLNAVVGDGLVHLTWHLPMPNPEISDLTLNFFNVYRNGVLLISNIKQTQYKDLDVVNQNEYTYYVTAVYIYLEENAESMPSNSIGLTTRFPVRNLKATAIKHDIKLDWTAPVGGGATGYNIFRNEVLLNTTPITALTYTDEDTTPAANYTYEIIAIYSGGESLPVAVSIIVPLLAPPTNLIAKVVKGDIELNWEMPVDILEFEVLLGFNVYRDEEQLTSEPIMDLFYNDIVTVEGIYIYKIIAVYEQGQSEPIEIEVNVIDITDASDLPVNFIDRLFGNYPNPFNPNTNIMFSTEKQGNVTIDVYNIRGQKVVTLLNGTLEAGEHSVVWSGLDESGRNVGSGVYFYHMKKDDFSEMKRMVLMK